MHDNNTLVATITARQGAREKVLLALKTVEHDVQGEGKQAAEIVHSDS